MLRLGSTWIHSYLTLETGYYSLTSWGVYLIDSCLNIKGLPFCELLFKQELAELYPDALATMEFD